MEPGTRVAGRYEVIRELGRGAMAAVYLALDVKFGVHIALKIAPALRANAYDEFRARFVREARIGYLLGRQEGFVRALDWGELPGGDLYLAADLVPDATSLDLRAGARPIPERVAALLKVAHLVGRVHAHGVVHRDIKPANVLVSGSGDLYLTDFGMAKASDHDAEADLVGFTLRTGRDAYLGTPQFMPPEQFEDAAGVDSRADIYALGVMLFHAVTGSYPYEARSGVELICRQLAVRAGEEPSPRPRDRDPHVDPIIDEVCARALAVDPAARPQTVQDLMGALSPVARPAERLSAAFVAAMGAAVPREGAPSASPSPTAAAQGAASGRLTELVEPDGLVPREALHELRRRIGRQAMHALLLGEAFLVVQEEREFQGRVRYRGRVGLLRRRAGRGADDPDDVLVGRSREQADIAFTLPTISNVQLRLRRGDDRWTVTETGSRNGTELNGQRLVCGRAERLRDGDVLYLSKHLTIAFHDAAGLERWLDA